MVTRLDLDLRGLTVVTECASGAYAYTPITALLAGARVFALGRDGSYGKFEDHARVLRALCSEFSLDGELRIEHKSSFDAWSEADIVTNSGMLRPLTGAIISQLKPTAVIPLMWEPWEFRDDDLDLRAALQKGIPVIGTNEHHPHADMFGYPGMLALHLLFNLGIEGWNNRLVLLGGGLTGKLIAETFQQLGFDFDWYTLTGQEQPHRCYPYTELGRILDYPHLDAIVSADHVYREQILGPQGFLSFSAIYERFPHLRYGHLCGGVDAAELAATGLEYLPEAIRSAGYMSYETDNLGPRPVIELSSAGLKVGELGARARLSGKTEAEAAQVVVDHGIGLYFEEEFLRAYRSPV